MRRFHCVSIFNTVKRLCSAIALLTTWLTPAELCDPVNDATRIAVAGGSITEIVYLLGYENRLVGVDLTSNFPKAATDLPSVGYVRNLSVEGLLSLQPTLILGEDDMGPPAVLQQLENAGVETKRIPEHHDANGILAKIECVASLLDVPSSESAPSLEQVRVMAAQLEEASANHANSVNVALLLSLNGGAPVAAGDNTSGGGFLRMVGARNVFASVDGWKPVSPEYMAAANPDVILVPTRGADAIGGAEGVASHPSLRATNASLNDRIFIIDGMAMLGFGPRTLQTALDFAKELRLSSVAVSSE